MSWATPKTNWVSSDGVATTDLTRIEENVRILSQFGGSAYGVTATSTTAYTVTADPPITALTVGVCVTIKMHATNTAAVTLAVNGLTATAIKTITGAALAAGDLLIDSVYTVVYNGTSFFLQNGDPSKVAKVGDTMSGALTMARNAVVQPQLKDYSETLTTDASVTSTKTLDISTGNVFDLTLTGDVTITITNPATSGQACSITLIIRQGAAAKVITWPSSVKWNNDDIPDISNVSTTSIITLLTLNAGTRWYGSLGGNNFTT